MSCDPLPGFPGIVAWAPRPWFSEFPGSSGSVPCIACIALHMSLHIALHGMAFHGTKWHRIASQLYCIALHCIALSCVPTHKCDAHATYGWSTPGPRRIHHELSEDEAPPRNGKRCKLGKPASSACVKCSELSEDEHNALCATSAHREHSQHRCETGVGVGYDMKCPKMKLIRTHACTCVYL